LRNINKSLKDLPMVSVVIPTHNRKEKLTRLIKSILESDYPKDKLEIIVIDDASTDGTYERVKKLFLQVKIIRNDNEKLVSEWRHIGIKISRGKYIFLIDDDNVVAKNAIKELVKFMEEHSEVGVAGPIMYFLKDPSRIWCAGVKRNYWITTTKFVGFNTRDSSRYKEPCESEDFPNAFMVRREVFEKIGLFNSKIFPIQYEEGDFCQRVKRSKYKVMVVPTAKVWHDIPLPEQIRTWTRRLNSPLRAYCIARNRVLFHTLWSRNALQRVVAILASIIISIYYIVMTLRYSSDNRHVVIKSIIKGIIDAFKLIKKVASH